jgi:hypothetical protein
MNRRDNKERTVAGLGGNGGETHRRFNFDLWISFCTLGDVIFVWLRLRLFRLPELLYVYYRKELPRFIGVASLFKCLTSGRGLDRTAAGKGGKCYLIFLQTGVRWRFQSNSEIAHSQQHFLSLYVQSRMFQMKQVHARIPPPPHLQFQVQCKPRL